MKAIIYIILNILKNKSVLVLGTLLIISSCEEFVKVEPPKTEITSTTVFTSDASAVSAIRGIYSLMMTNSSFTKGEMERYTGLSADELINYSNSNEQQQFYLPSLLASNGVVLSVFWGEAYKYINNANAVLEGLNKSTALSTATKNQLEGESRFIRAFCHFYLTNLFGDVPYITTIDYKINSVVQRMTQAEVYEMMIEDLLSAQNLMSDTFSFSNNERVQPNKGAVTALLARVYLFTEDWSKAEAQASNMITNTSTYSLSDINEVFLANSTEAIWQLQPVVPGTNTMQGQLFILNDVPANVSGNVSISEELYNSFELNDSRMNNWIGMFTDGTDTYHYPYKYKVNYSSTVTEYAMVLRLAEQYLIRAEARAQQNNVRGAQLDINMIRNRAGLGDTPASDKASLLLAIEQERKVELFTEWGHRWLDLKRTNKVDAVLSPLKSDWQATDAFYPIPQSERLVNPQLTQNPGY